MINIGVNKLFRYPIKSMGGESVSTFDFTERGGVGDRVWAVRDEIRGGIRGAKKIPGPMKFNAEFVGDVKEGELNPALIRAPDGDTCMSDASNINEWLSEKLDHQVTMWPLLPIDALDHYRRGPPDHEDTEVELRELFGREPGQPLPDLSVFSQDIFEYETPPGTYFDAYPILLMTLQSLESLQAHRPESVFDVRRFRPNILLELGESKMQFPEFEWLGKKLKLGSLVLEVDILCPRCVMTTLAFDNLPKDSGVMRALVETTGTGNLGVYARVVQSGVVNVGDQIEFVE